MVDQGSTTSPRPVEHAGPVTMAIRAMTEAERADIALLRQAIADRIERDIELLDAIDRGELV